MKRIMIIGAGLSQVPLIEKAKEMGLFTVVVDGNPNAPGRELSDIFEVCSTKDPVKAVEIAKQHGVNGVLTIGTDSGVVSVASVAQELGLPGISVDSAIAATDKSIMRQRFRDKGVPSPAFVICENEEARHELASSIGYPIVIKPIDNAGSLGVIKVEGPDQLDPAYAKAVSCSSTGRVIIEEYMDGPEVSVESLTYKGETSIIAITDKMTSMHPYCVELGHTIPSELPQDIQEQISQAAEDGLRALGVDVGGGHSEIKITKDGPKIVEIGARLGGWIGADLVPLATGVDIVKECIKLCLGEAPDTGIKASRGAALRVLQSKPGKIIGFRGLDEIRHMNGIEILETYLEEGDVVRSLESGFDRIGRVVAVGDNRDMAIERAGSAVKLFGVDVE